MHHHERNYVASVHADRVQRVTGNALPADIERTLAAAETGDGRAWAVLFARFRGPITRIARSYGLNAHEVDDVAQETWVRLLGHIDSLRDPSAVGAWLRTTAHRESLRALARRRREQLTDSWDDADVASEEDLDELIVDADRRAALRRALRSLPPHQRSLIELLLQERDPTYAQIAEELDIPIGSIGPTRARCVERLRRELVPAAA
jgi:RNA polymerase sigma factor (sigma-70 family)